MNAYLRFLRLCIRLRLEGLLLLASLFMALNANQPFLSAVEVQESESLSMAMFVFICALNFLLLGVLATRRNVRLLLSVLLPVSALTSYYIGRYGIVVDAGMLRNVL